MRFNLFQNIVLCSLKKDRFLILGCFVRRDSFDIRGQLLRENKNVVKLYNIGYSIKNVLIRYTLK